MKMSDLK